MVSQTTVNQMSGWDIHLVTALDVLAKKRDIYQYGRPSQLQSENMWNISEIIHMFKSPSYGVVLLLDTVVRLLLCLIYKINCIIGVYV